GSVAPPDRALAETQLLADPLTGRVEGEPWEFVGVHVEHEHDGTGVQGVGRTEEPAGHPLLLEGPADVGVAEPKPLRGDVRHLDEMPDRRRTLHVTIVAAVGRSG